MPYLDNTLLNLVMRQRQSMLERADAKKRADTEMQMRANQLGSAQLDNARKEIDNYAAQRAAAEVALGMQPTGVAAENPMGQVGAMQQQYRMNEQTRAEEQAAATAAARQQWEESKLGQTLGSNEKIARGHDLSRIRAAGLRQSAESTALERQNRDQKFRLAVQDLSNLDGQIRQMQQLVSKPETSSLQREQLNLDIQRLSEERTKRMVVLGHTYGSAALQQLYPSTPGASDIPGLEAIPVGSNGGYDASEW